MKPGHFLFAFLLSGIHALAQVNGYARIDTMLTMRDGVRLYTEIYAPEGETEKLPIILTRTAYGVRNGNSSYGDYRLNDAYKTLARDQYIFVFQDMRGKYRSEGTYSLLRPLAGNDTANESTDAFDTMEWLIRHTNNNGKIGMTGNSYNSWLAAMALINPHPALAAVNLQGTPADLYVGDDFFHHGAFRLSPSFGFAVIEKEERGFAFENNDAYRWFLKKGCLDSLNGKSVLNNSNPFWSDFMKHQNYDSFWESRSLTKYLKNTTVPTLNVAGWWDDQDLYGSLKIYEQLEKNDSLNLNYLVAGPWYHAGWEDPDEYYKKIHLGGSVSTYYLNEIQARWFYHHLKGGADFNLAEATIYKTGRNKWETFKEWPPIEKVNRVKWYLNTDSRLSQDKPTARNSFDSYVSDPKNPVPYMDGTIPDFWQGGSLGWKADNQATFTEREDVLSWVSNPLSQDLDISGNISMRLFASTTGTDSDWIVKVIDVYPPDFDPISESSKFDMDNFQMLVADEVIRAKYRNDLKNPEPVPSGQVIQYDIDLLSRSHTFKKGHRIMIHIQSSWFPLIDMNPQQFIEIDKAGPQDYKSATQKVYHSKVTASYLDLPVVEHR